MAVPFQLKVEKPANLLDFSKEFLRSCLVAVTPRLANFIWIGPPLKPHACWSEQTQGQSTFVDI